MKQSSFSAGFVLACSLLSACQMQQSTDTDDSGAVWKSEAYAVYRDSVVQGKHVARVLSPTSLTSNYQSPANEFQSPEINFKFSINGKDNELAPGQDHRFIAVPRAGKTAPELPVIVFGQRYVDPGAVPANLYLPPNTPMKIRLDMRPVLAAFKKQGYYTTFKGEKIYKEDFKKVFVAGNTAPLSWDFDNLVNKPELELKDSDGNGIYEATLTLNAPQAAKTTAGKWEKSVKTDDFPQYTSEYPIADALYNLALEEARRAVEPDSTFRTGKEWAGVWTRDISYSIILSMAMLQPEVAMKSLMRKVSEDGRIIQDTGTGGAYPCSTDRMIWATAAWEIYKVTGDEQWLRTVYPIIKKSIEDDIQNAYNSQTGMVRGESSFLDWREQTYPKWMQPVDIYESETLGTNAVHYQGNVVLSQMARILGEPVVASKHQQLAEQIKQGMNKHLWLAEKGYYGQFLYGRTYKILSPRAEALGEALSVLFGVAEGDRAERVVQKTPTTPFGISCIYPQIPGIPPYHNNGVWPFVQSYWALAAAKVGNQASLTESMAAIYRPAALFLTNKENFVAENGDFAGTQINSSNMLWSLSGSLSLVYKVLFGMDFQADKLVFRPFVPQAFAGPRKLAGFKYRGAVLDIEMEGYGNEITTITLDDKPLANATIPATLTGRHKVRILLLGKAPQMAPVNQVANRFSPAAPEVAFANNRITWNKQEGVRSYRILRNGQAIATTTALESPADATGYAEYQVVAVDASGLESFASEPLVVNGEKFSQLYQLESVAPKAALPYKGFTGQGFVEISKTKNKALTIPVTVPLTGLYAIDFRYSNGNGPINTENKCAIRTLRNGQQQLGTIVMPQRGVAEWSNWGFSNSVLVRLENGPQTLTLAFESANENMNGAVNQAMLDYVRLTRVQ
ncbi:glycogen debranching protein [Hymenobacter sp. BT188]|nr:glycogen debranching protein [Hymenobacter sp. BT188]